jgi:hypothetical protein
MDSETQTELKATVAARQELGPEHDEHLVAGFLDRIEKEIDRRVDTKLTHSRGSQRSHRVDLGIFIPLFIFAGIWGGPLGITAAAAALVVVFLVSELRR